MDNRLNGNLHIPTESGDIIDHAPVSYYQFSENTTIESGFSLQNNTVTLLIPTHDPSKTLIFDPWISNPAFNNANKIWEVETDNSGNIYIMGGDMPIKVRKYNSAGTILWTYTTPWDSSSHWIGTMKVQPITGDVYITAGSQAEIAKLNSGGTQQWLTTGAFTDEYWALAFNCDYTQLVAGGTRITGIPIPTGSGRAFNINMNNGAVISNVTVGTTTAGFLINDINEIRTICYSPNGNFYFLTLDTIGSMTPALALNYRVGSTYRYSYGSPNFGFTPQPQHTIAANGNFIYTHNGVTLHKRSLSTGAIISSIAIPGGGATNLAPFGVGTSPKNGGIALDSCGNVYVGSQTQVHKFDANLSLISSVTTTNAVYDLAVNYSNGEIVACGNGFVASINMSACNPMPVSCNVSFSSSVSGNNIACNGQCTGSATANPSGGSSPFTFLWSNSQTSQTITGLCPGTFTVTISDALGNSSSASVTITQPNPIVINVTGTTPTGCTGSTGTAAVSVSGGTGNITLTWSSNPVQTGPNATNLAAGTYTVTGVDSLGCSVTSGSIVIASTGQANVVISPRTISICKNDTISFIASGALTYVWTPGGSTGNTFTLSPSGSMQVIVTGTDAFGCTDSDTANVIVWPPTATPTITNVGNVLTCNPAAPSYQWYLNGVPINGAISQNHTATQSGNYTVVIRDINECYSSPSAPFFLTGTEPGFQAGIEFEIYPNPTTGIFDLIISTQNNNKKIDVFIADVQGKTIYQATLSVNNSSVTKRIDISGYARGIYTLTLVSEKGMMTRKIEKKE